MRFRKKDLRKLLGGVVVAGHTNNTKNCYISRYRNLMLVCSVGFPHHHPGTYWGGPGNVVMAKREQKEIDPIRLRRKQAVPRMEGADGRVQRLAWNKQAEQ